MTQTEPFLPTSYSDPIVIPITFTIPALATARSSNSLSANSNVRPPFNGWGKESNKPRFRVTDAESSITPPRSDVVGAQYNPDDLVNRPTPLPMPEDLRAQAEGRPINPRLVARPFTSAQLGVSS